MKRWAFTAILTAGMLLGSTTFAAPTDDCAKTVDEWETLQVTSKFSKLYGQGPSAPYGYGGFEEARHILTGALRHTEHMYNQWEKIETLDRAVRDARRVCEGSAERFAHMLGVFSSAYGDINNFADKYAAMRGGVEYLVNSQPSAMTKDLCTLGVAMTRPAMSNYFSATQIFDRIIAAAERAAQKEEKQWGSLLAFARKASDNLNHFQSKYALQSRIARAIVDAMPNEAVFLKALADVAGMDLNNSWDQFQVIITGLRQYAQDVPADNHRQAVTFLIAAADDINDKAAAVRMYRGIMPNLVGLDFQTPGARIILRAGIQMSGNSFLNGFDRYGVARKAVDHVLRLNVPPQVADQLRWGVREADNCYGDYGRKADILRDYMQRAVR